MQKEQEQEEQVIEIDLDIISELDELKKQISDLTKEISSFKHTEEAKAEAKTVEKVVEKVVESKPDIKTCPYSEDGSGRCPYLIKIYDGDEDVLECPMKSGTCPMKNGTCPMKSIDISNMGGSIVGMGGMGGMSNNLCGSEKCPIIDIFAVFIVLFFMFMAYKNLLKLLNCF